MNRDYANINAMEEWRDNVLKYLSTLSFYIVRGNDVSVEADKFNTYINIERNHYKEVIRLTTGSGFAVYDVSYWKELSKDINIDGRNLVLTNDEYIYLLDTRNYRGMKVAAGLMLDVLRFVRNRTADVDQLQRYIHDLKIAYSAIDAIDHCRLLDNDQYVVSRDNGRLTFNLQKSDVSLVVFDCSNDTIEVHSDTGTVNTVNFSDIAKVTLSGNQIPVITYANSILEKMKDPDIDVIEYIKSYYRVF